MPNSTPSGYRSLFLTSIILALLGWLGLLLLLFGTRPTVGPRWLFFFLWILALAGTSLPLVWVLNWRFAPGTAQSVLLRESLLVGLYGALCVWLQINRSLSLPLALLLASGLIAIEWLLRSFAGPPWRRQL
jgi:hypothetical protein